MPTFFVIINRLGHFLKQREEFPAFLCHFGMIVGQQKQFKSFTLGSGKSYRPNDSLWKISGRLSMMKIICCSPTVETDYTGWLCFIFSGIK